MAANQQLILNQGQTKTAISTPRDDNENPGTINGAPTWHPSHPSLTVVPSADGLSAAITAGNVPGTFHIDEAAQGQPSGPFNVQSTLDVIVNMAVATHFFYTFA